MQRFLGMTRWGALFVTGWLLAALPGCGSSADVASCTSRSCDGYGAGGNDATALKDKSPILEIAAPLDSGPSRSLLCGTTGCFPGFRNACGVNPTGDGGYITFSDGKDSDSGGPDGAPSNATADATAREDGDRTSDPDAPPQAPG